jgi:hypothetical protein
MWCWRSYSLDGTVGEDAEVMGREMNAAAEELETCGDELEYWGNRLALPPGDPDRLERRTWEGVNRGLTKRRADAMAVLERLQRVASSPTPPQGLRSDRDRLRGWFDQLSTVDQKRAFLKARLVGVGILPARPGAKVFDPERVLVRFADAQESR